MIYLILGVLSGAAVAIVIRMSAGHVKSKLSMLAVNYFTCLLCSWAISGFGNPLPQAEGIGRAAGLGVLNGCFYATSLLLNQYNISTSGVILASVFSKMGGMLVPLLVSLLLFAELPTPFQIAGIVLSVVSVIVLNYQKSDKGLRGSFKLSLFALLLGEGCVSAMAKVYREWGVAPLEANYLLVTFFVAFAMIATLVMARRERPGLPEMIYGFFIGLPNFLCARFILLALNSIPAAVVYPSRGIGTILTISVAGVALFGERLNKRQIVAVAVILLSLVLLNI